MNIRPSAVIRRCAPTCVIAATHPRHAHARRRRPRFRRRPFLSSQRHSGHPAATARPAQRYRSARPPFRRGGAQFGPSRPAASRPRRCNGSNVYDWPGNVRELGNVVQRLAVRLARYHRLRPRRRDGAAAKQESDGVIEPAALISPSRRRLGARTDRRCAGEGDLHETARSDCRSGTFPVCPARRPRQPARSRATARHQSQHTAQAAGAAGHRSRASLINDNRPGIGAFGRHARNLCVF